MPLLSCDLSGSLLTPAGSLRRFPITSPTKSL